MYIDEEMDEIEEVLETRRKRGARQDADKLQRCEFCGTNAPEHDVRMRHPKGCEKGYMLCDNPVCNAVTEDFRVDPKKRRRYN